MRKAALIPSKTRYWLGVVACLGYAGHAAHYALQGEIEQMLWICHVSALAAGIGLIANSAIINAAGLMGLCVGLPTWLLYLFGGGVFIPTSVLTHVLGFAIAFGGSVALGIPRYSWAAALGMVFSLMIVCRFVTSAESNINLAFGPDPDLSLWNVGGAPHWLLQLGQWGLAFGALQFVLERLLPRSRQLPDSAQ